MNPLSQQIIVARAARKWSQRDLALEMGVSQQTVAHWESGGTPRKKRYEKLRDLLGLGIDLAKPVGKHELTLRDYFAAKAMQGLLSDTGVRSTPEEFAANSYVVADAMLKARGA
jgi:transcriptional regulator with XRE-family HTH domain